MIAFFVLLSLGFAGLVAWLRFFTVKAVFVGDPTVMVLASEGIRWANPPLTLTDLPQRRVLFSDENGLPLERLYDTILQHGEWIALGLLLLALVLAAAGQMRG